MSHINIASGAGIRFLTNSSSLRHSSTANRFRLSRRRPYRPQKSQAHSDVPFPNMKLAKYSASLVQVNRWFESKRNTFGKAASLRIFPLRSNMNRRRLRVRRHVLSKSTMTALSTVISPKIELPTTTTVTSSSILPNTDEWLNQLKTSPANWMTASRIVIAPFLGYFILYDYNSAAIAGCCLAALSDGFDGYVARRFDCKTQLGTYLDPLADKVVINVLSLSLWANGTLPTYIVGVWFCKDVAIATGGAAFYLQSQRPSLEPTIVSKWNTAFQFATLAVALVDSTTESTTSGAILQGLLPLTCFTTLASAVSYTDHLRLLLHGSKEN